MLVVASIQAANDGGTPIAVTLIGAIVGATAVITVGILNYFTQRRQLREQRELLEGQRSEQEKQFERQLNEAHEQLSILREGQITERYTKAVDQLGSEKPDVRLGAIYALERVAKSSEREGRTIMEVLTAYVQGHAPWPPRESGQPSAQIAPKDLHRLVTWSPDVQAAMTVVARRDVEDGHEDILNLIGVDLRMAELTGANLSGAVIRESCLQRTILARANLRKADLARSNLEGADLRDADLSGARLRRANLRSVDFGGAHLQSADLEHSDLRLAILRGANLEGATAATDTRWPDGFNPAAFGVIINQGG
jgi:Pentapeptide repeats (8 copies)